MYCFDADEITPDPNMINDWLKRERGVTDRPRPRVYIPDAPSEPNPRVDEDRSDGEDSKRGVSVFKL